MRQPHLHAPGLEEGNLVFQMYIKVYVHLKHKVSERVRAQESDVRVAATDMSAVCGLLRARLAELVR